MPTEDNTLSKFEKILANTTFVNPENKTENNAFLDCAKTLLANNHFAKELLEAAIRQLSNFQIMVVDDHTIATFGVCTPGKWPTISIQNSLNAFEKVMILVFELCNLCNKELSNVDVNNFDTPEAYAEAKEQAEFKSLEKAQSIYQHGRNECGWPDANIEFEKMKAMWPLLKFSQKDYLEWSITPQPHLNGFIHASMYTNQFLLWQSEPRKKRKVTCASDNEETLQRDENNQVNLA